MSAPGKRVRRRAPRGAGEQLRAEIISVTRQLLAEAANADAVSIRGVAQAVGVTPPSIYLHFADKNALLDAVVMDVFAELDAAMLAAAEGVEEPLGRLRAFGLAYVQFAISHPEHYRIATMDPCADPDSGMDEVLRASAFDHFRETVEACMRAGIFADGDPLPITLDLWAAAHGIASLMIVKPYLPWAGAAAEQTPESQLAAIDRMLCTAAVGHAAMQLLGDDVEPAGVTRWLDGQNRRPRGRGARR